MNRRMKMLGVLFGAALISAVSVNAAETDNNEMMTGAYESYEEEGMSEEATNAFEKALENYDGEDVLSPLQLLETQLVAGMNYRILCDSDTPDFQRNQVIVTVYQDLDGNCEITDITVENKVIMPLKSENPLEEKDFTKSVSFSAEDFNWDDMTLEATVYEEALYDMVDMHELKVGDLIYVEGIDLPIETLEEQSGDICVNDYLTFSSEDGGTFSVRMENDYYGKIEDGKVTLPLSEALQFTDCTTEPGSSVEVALEDLPEHLKTATGYYSCNNTVMQVENGVITSIVRTWTP